MTIRYITGSTVVSTPGTDALTAAAGDTIIVASSGVLGATAALGGSNPVAGIFGSVTGSLQVFNSGLIFGTDYGINLTSTTFAKVVVGATGQVFSDSVAVELATASTTVENLGLIQGQDFGLALTANLSSFVRNDGTISANSWGIYCFSGDLTLVNTGMISASGGAAMRQNSDFVASVWNSGTIIGDVYLGDGNDIYQGGGTVNGRVNGEGGDDTLIGGDRDDTFFDTTGANWIGGGNGNDTVGIGVSGTGMQTSYLFGGIIGGADTAGSDVLRVTNDGVMGANIFLSAGAAVGSVTRTSDGAVAAWITGFENAVGTLRADAIIGSSAANAIEGGDGGDWMVGNGGADRFVFRFAFHAMAGDQIRDFRRSEGDRIDLSGIDANAATTTNDAFIFRATRTSNAAAEAVVTNFGNSARVDVYTNADNVADGTFIVVYGEAGVTNLQLADFIL